MKKTLRKALAFATVVCVAFVCTIVPVSVSAGSTAAYKTMTFRPSKSASENYSRLSKMIRGNKTKVIRFKSGTTTRVSSTLFPGSNTTIIATGAKIIMGRAEDAIFTIPKKTNYGSIKNLKVIGGTWRRSGESTGGAHSYFAICHGTNITFDNVDVECNYKGHAIEIIACKNVVIKNSTVKAVGKCPKNCKEEQIQIDLATKKTAPRVALYGKKYVKGQTCHNVYIENNTVSGATGIRVNWNKKEYNHYHTNINIIGNKFRGVRTEALTVINAIGVTLKDNYARTTGSASSKSSSIGIHVDLFGKVPESVKTSEVTVTGNTAYGGRNAIFIFNHSKYKYGKMTVTDNIGYCKNGAENAIPEKMCRQCADTYDYAGNTEYNW